MTGSTEVSALVLRRTDYRDYDRMITLLTAENGKVEAVVRGCRRPKSELINAAEPFVCGKYRLFMAHGRYTVTQCSVTDGFYPLREDIDRLTLGAGWLKLLEETSVYDEPAGELFDLALKAISFLSYTGTDLKLLNAMFLMKLLRILGMSPLADRCFVCGKSAGENENMRFDALRGGCACLSCAPSAPPISYGARRILLKAPRAPFKSVELLLTHPDWREAADRIEDFAHKRLNQNA